MWKGCGGDSLLWVIMVASNDWNARCTSQRGVLNFYVGVSFEIIPVLRIWLLIPLHPTRASHPFHGVGGTVALVSGCICLFTTTPTNPPMPSQHSSFPIQAALSGPCVFSFLPSIVMMSCTLLSDSSQQSKNYRLFFFSFVLYDAFTFEMKPRSQSLVFDQSLLSIEQRSGSVPLLHLAVKLLFWARINVMISHSGSPSWLGFESRLWQLRIQRSTTKLPHYPVIPLG